MDKMLCYNVQSPNIVCVRCPSMGYEGEDVGRNFQLQYSVKNGEVIPHCFFCNRCAEVSYSILGKFHKLESQLLMSITGLSSSWGSSNDLARLVMRQALILATPEDY